ncbi:hypothetical protein HHI36_013422 [Cryptolaemus montrouzieri]|uniref:Uncharacterized protein n=1 Tax=Cryptolaemus montrouzieri TaxID=559131 RepID=A0ABD2NHC6_9CUCU
MDRFNENFPKKRVKANYNKNRVVMPSPEIAALKNKVDASYTIFRVRRDDASEQLDKTLKSRLKRTMDSSIRSGQCEQIANAFNRSKEIWKIINAEVKEPKSVNKL